MPDLRRDGLLDGCEIQPAVPDETLQLIVQFLFLLQIGLPLSGFFQSAQSGNNKEESEAESSLKCPNCGLSYATFQKTGLLGCAQCYQAFREPLEVILKRIHGNTQHTGRVPRQGNSSIGAQLQIDQLKRKLAQAVAAEEYETAAALRDQIRALQKQTGGENSPDAPKEESSHERA